MEVHDTSPRRRAQSYIAGGSVHSACIERLWKDLKICVVSTFRQIFWTLEDTGVLNIENDTDLFCLPFVYSSH